MKKIILSYDYELFFGDKSGTVQKTLIEPTNFILDAMDSVNAKANFFVDWLMLKYLKETNTVRTNEDYKLIVDQLHNMIRRGHRIELHIHPHWVDAKYNGDGTWDFSNFKHYSLNSFSENEIINMFVEGTKLLTNIAKEIDPEYELVAFRAGGWAVQPFNLLRKAFEKTGIKIDSSVAIGIAGQNQYSSYDFSNVNTSSKELYRFDSDVTYEVKNGHFIEVPISTYSRNIIYRVIDKLYRTFSKNNIVISDGTHLRTGMHYNYYSTRSMITLSRISPLSVYLSILSQTEPLITIIDHPKDFTLSAITSISLLKRYNTIQYKDLL